MTDRTTAGKPEPIDASRGDKRYPAVTFLAASNLAEVGRSQAMDGITVAKKRGIVGQLKGSLDA